VRARGDTTPGQDAAHDVLRRSTVELHLPVLGRINVPVDHLAWYAAVVGLAAFEVLDWPVAAIVVVGKMLSDNHRYRLLEQFGRALDELAV
jgi:hypothetical protein